MENLVNYTPTELLKLINVAKASHDQLKQEIIDHTFEIDEIERLINTKINQLDEIEKKYIALIEEMNNR